MKKIEWLGSSKKDLDSLPADQKHEMGLQLMYVQFGATPSSFKPMPSVGAGVYEIRITGEDGISRCFYATKYEDRILVLHVFIKKTQKTAQHDIDLGKKRLAEWKGMQK